MDAFIEHRTEFLLIGKILISQVLASCENENKLFSTRPEIGIGDHWYEYIWGKLNTSYDKFDTNNVSFITFNYDRSLEYYLLTCMKNTYGRRVEDVAEKLKSIPIIHLYGALGYLPLLENGKSVREYTSNIASPDIIEICIDSIKIIHEGVDLEKDAQFKCAYDLIRNADVICFLGFGYDQTNLSRLKLNDLLSTKQVLLGSSYGLLKAEIEKIVSLVQTSRSRPFRIDKTGQNKCMNYLRNIANYI